jgi:aspartate/methionine/tyrosine aminotransferase
VIADEVYQDNVYLPGDRFVSFSGALEKRSIRDVSLFSFHSVSKGLLGECGHRGGYLECRNVPDAVMDEITKLQSISLCANSVGQIVTFLLVRPPRPGDPSHATYVRERGEILETLRRRAEIVARGLNAVPGITCNPVAGAMYAFPRIALPGRDRLSGASRCSRRPASAWCLAPASVRRRVPGTSAPPSCRRSSRSRRSSSASAAST